MKKTIFIAACLSLNLNLRGQTIINSDFETWVTLPNTFGGMDPTGWKSTNAATAGANIKGITRSTDKHSGTYALALSPLIATPGLNDTLTSAIVLGQAPLNFTTYKLSYEKGGQPFGKMIASVNGYYKFSKSTTYFDSAYAIVLIKDAATANYLGIGQFGFSPSASYIPFQIDISPLPSFGGPADSLMIAFFYKSTNQNSIPQGKLLIDSLYYNEMVNTSGIRDEQNSGLSLYPNPFTETFYLAFGVPGDYKIEVLSPEGLIIYEQELKNVTSHELTLSASTKGIYFLRCTFLQNGRQYIRMILSR